jgi:FixJ family two-component response regulator
VDVCLTERDIAERKSENNRTAVQRRSSRPLLSAFPPDALVSIVDDEDSVRRSLMRLFRSVHVTAESFDSARAYLERPVHDGPGCLVLDVQMPGIDGLELQRDLAARKTQIVFVTGRGDVPMCAEAMKAGAVDFLTKPVDEEELFKAVARGLERSIELRKSGADHADARSRIDALTPREFEVMQRVIAGLLNKQIAGELGASEKTIKIHRGRVMEKMRVASVPDLVRMAQVAGVLPVQASQN